MVAKRRQRDYSPLFCLALVILLALLLIILYFAVFKPRDPDVETTVVGLRQLVFRPPPRFTLNISLSIDVTIDNPNYVAFRYGGATTLVYYRGALVGQAPVVDGVISSRWTDTVKTVVELQVATMAAIPAFSQDVASGTLTLQSSTSLKGKVTVLGIFRRHPSTFTSCLIVVSLTTISTSAECNSKVHH